MGWGWEEVVRFQVYFRAKSIGLDSRLDAVMREEEVSRCIVPGISATKWTHLATPYPVWIQT